MRIAKTLNRIPAIPRGVAIRTSVTFEPETLGEAVVEGDDGVGDVEASLIDF